MDDKKMIENFGDMVSATEKLTKPWRIALIVTNILWAIVVVMLVSYAYLIPSEMTQEQDFPSQHQTQTYIDGATSGG